MKTAEEILDNCEYDNRNIVMNSRQYREMIIEAMEEYANQFKSEAPQSVSDVYPKEFIEWMTWDVQLRRFCDDFQNNNKTYGLNGIIYTLEELYNHWIITTVKEVTMRDKLESKQGVSVLSDDEIENHAKDIFEPNDNEPQYNKPEYTEIYIEGAKWMRDRMKDTITTTDLKDIDNARGLSPILAYFPPWL